MMTTTASREAVLYCQGTFSAENPTPTQWKQMIEAAKDIGTSGFTTVILGQFHVHPDGTIFYNDSPLSTVMEALQAIPTLLKRAGIVKRVLITFGPFASDFSSIASHLSDFKATMATLMSSSGIDGLDWDLEQQLEQFTDLLVDLTVWASKLGRQVTAAPYYDQPFWTSVLDKTQAQGGRFAWWNLQLYGGAQYDQWVTSSVPAAFLFPGFANTQGATPGSIQAAIQNLAGSYPTIRGGFLWRYESIAGSGYTTAQYAQGILGGLPAAAR